VAQLNLSSTKFGFYKFWDYKNHLAADLILKSMLVRAWDEMAPSRVREGDAKLVR